MPTISAVLIRIRYKARYPPPPRGGATATVDGYILRAFDRMEFDLSSYYSWKTKLKSFRPNKQIAF